MDTAGQAELEPGAGLRLCRMIRGVLPVPALSDLEDLERRGLVTRVTPAELRDAERCRELYAERERLLQRLSEVGVPRGLAAVLPGAARRARKRAADLQEQLDSADAERRAIEQAHSVLRREAWSHLPLAAPTSDGGRVVVTLAGQRAARRFWSSSAAVPERAALDGRLAERAAAAADAAASIGAWRKLPPEPAWVAAVLLSRRPDGSGLGRVEALKVFHAWLERQQTWGDDLFDAAVLLAMSGEPPAPAARAAADLYEGLREQGLGTEVATLAAACYLAGRPTWIARVQRLEAMEWLAGRGDELRLAQRQLLPMVAVLTSLPRPASETALGLRALRQVLGRQVGSGSATLDVAAAVMAATGFGCPERHEGQDLFATDDPAVHAMAARHPALADALFALDGSLPGPTSRHEVMAGAAAYLPGPAGQVGAVLVAARDALRAAGAPDDACRAPAAIALAAETYGAEAGCIGGDLAWGLLRVDRIVAGAWRTGPGRVPEVKSLEAWH